MTHHYLRDATLASKGLTRRVLKGKYFILTMKRLFANSLFAAPSLRRALRDTPRRDVNHVRYSTYRPVDCVFGLAPASVCARVKTLSAFNSQSCPIPFDKFMSSILSGNWTPQARGAFSHGERARWQNGCEHALSRLKNLAARLIWILLSLGSSTYASQTGSQSPSATGVTFTDSIKEIAPGTSQAAPGPGVTLLRSQLTQLEAEETIDFSIALKMRNFAELQGRVGKGEIISLDEMAAKYCPAVADYNKVAEWLTAQGFTVKPVAKYNLSVFAAGTVTQIERVFQTKFGRVKVGGVEYTSALRAPTLPSDVASPVLGVNGLQRHLHPRFHSRFAPAGPQKLINNAPPYTISEIEKTYGASGLSVSGSGQKIGIVIDTFPADSDLTAFWMDNGIAQSLSNIEKVQVVSGALPTPSGEETLDVEWSSGTAAGAGVRVYATTDLQFVHLDQAYQAIINDLPTQPALHQMSLSYGLGELYEAVSQIQTDAQYFASIAGAGVTVFVSSGDGASSPGLNGFEDNSGPVQVECPSNDPNVTGVGGTSLYLNSSTGAVSSESAWFYGGGGSSVYFSRPSWQTGAGVPAGSYRLVPDVALVADLNTGGFLILNGQLYTVGGTSWSAPTWAGFCAEINQARTNRGMHSLGLLGPKIYPLIGTAELRDITTGSNGANGIYNAGPGYDLCTGVGVPNVSNLIQKLSLARPVAKDFVGNGYADLVWEQTGNGQHEIWVMQNGVPAYGIALPTLPTQWHVAGVGDFTGNGRTDLVWENTVTGAHSIWIMQNGVRAYNIALPTLPTQWHVAGAGDFTASGQAGLVWENTVTGQHAIWIMQNGVPAYSIALPTLPTQWHIAGVGDFNGDGYADLVWEQTVTGQHAIWIMQNGVPAYSIALPTLPTQWHVAGAGDFNGDGYADLVWENKVTGERSIWIMQNGAPAYGIALPTLSTLWNIADH